MADRQKNGHLATKTGHFVDEPHKHIDPSTKMALFMDGKQKMTHLSTKQGVFVDGPK